MSAESSAIDTRGTVPEPSKALESVLVAFERATGLQVCIKPMSDRWRDTSGRDVIPVPYVGHRSAFCEAVRARAYAACAKNDRFDLPSVCFPPDGRIDEPFVRTCHAGADEVLLPLWSDGVLVAVIQVGQFTRETTTVATDGHALPRAADSDVEYFRTLTHPLRAYLFEVLRHLDESRLGHTGGRRAVIERYIRSTLSIGPTLAGLAARLSLSPSRTSHTVREVTGRSLRELIEESRITLARDLLVNGEGTVAWIASQTGFKDTAYFCRYFKAKTGMTPTTFREKYRRVLPV